MDNVTMCKKQKSDVQNKVQLGSTVLQSALLSCWKSGRFYVCYLVAALRLSQMNQRFS